MSKNILTAALPAQVSQPAHVGTALLSSSPALEDSHMSMNSLLHTGGHMLMPPACLSLTAFGTSFQDCPELSSSPGTTRPSTCSCMLL